MSISEKRREKNMTQKQLAEAIHVDTSVISKYEHGIISPPVYRLKAIAGVLGVPINELYPDSQHDELFIMNESLEAHARKATYYDEYVLDLSERNRQGERDRHAERDIHADLVVFYHNTELEKKIRTFANNNCELCGQEAPASTNGDKYLELHCIHWLCEGGLPEPQNMIVLCPNCHKYIHLSDDPDDEINMLRIASKHKDL